MIYLGIRWCQGVRQNKGEEVSDSGLISQKERLVSKSEVCPWAFSAIVAEHVPGPDSKKKVETLGVSKLVRWFLVPGPPAGAPGSRVMDREISGS